MEEFSNSSYFGSLNFEQVLDDLSSRFIVNLPTEELESIERICFQIEQAHWYYEDFVRPQASHLPSFSLRKFSEIIFKSNPLLSHFDATTAYDQFLRYKERVPVCGAILLSSRWDKCLVVKGWKSGASWSFPRGKINQGEDERDCAVREVWEETGYDISPHFNSAVIPHRSDAATCPPPLPPGQYRNDDYLECVMKEQRIRLYVVTNVSEDTLFETKTRKEISKIAWAPLTSLPTWTKKGKAAKKEIKCYMVTPFVNSLKAWIQCHRKLPIPNNNKEDGPTGPAVSASYTTAEDSRDTHLQEETHALQAFFFGNNSPSKSEYTMKEKSAVAASTQAPPTGESVAAFSTATSQSRYLQNLQVLSPVPKTSGTMVENLYRQVMSRSHEHLGSDKPSTGQGIPSSGESTIMGPFAHDNWMPYVPSPPSTSSRISAVSPSGLDADRSARGPMYTEAEREAARNSLLGQLASQLGTPTPPSVQEGSDNEMSDIEGTSRQASPGRQLLALMQRELAKSQASAEPARIPRYPAQTVPDIHAASTIASSAHQFPAPVAQQASSQHMLGILNGAGNSAYRAISPNGQALSTRTQGRTASGIVHERPAGQAHVSAPSNAAAHTSSLLNLFNTHSKPATGATSAAPRSGHADLARLFAGVDL